MLRRGKLLPEWIAMASGMALGGDPPAERSNELRVAYRERGISSRRPYQTRLTTLCVAETHRSPGPGAKPAQLRLGVP